MGLISSATSKPAAAQAITVNSAGFEVQVFDNILDLAQTELVRQSKHGFTTTVTRRVYAALIEAPLQRRHLTN